MQRNVSSCLMVFLIGVWVAQCVRAAGTSASPPAAPSPANTNVVAAVTNATPVAPETVTVSGVVRKQADASGKVTALKIVSADALYVVILDEAGHKLASQPDGAAVEVKGLVTVKDMRKHLTVKDWRRAEPPPPAAPAPSEKTPAATNVAPHTAAAKAASP